MTREIRRAQYPEVSPIEDGVILALWHRRLDTNSIARHLGLPESHVHNRLLHIRERDFRDTFGAEAGR